MSEDTIKTKVLIIGSGPAGYTAAIYAARANLAPVQVLGLQPGGQLTITSDVENFPGFPKPVSGPWLMGEMRAQAENVGTVMHEDMISAIDLGRRPFRATSDFGKSFEAETVIIATGAQARWLHVPGEAEYTGYGVSACATCDGFFYKGRKVLVIGGGNTAVEEALFLTNFASEVVVVHRRDKLRAEKLMQDRLFAHPKVSVIWNAAVEEVLGKSDIGFKEFTGVRLVDTATGAKRDVAADGMFVAIGHDPATTLFKGQLAMDGEGYIITSPDCTATSVPGVFAAGDVKDKTFRQAITAAGMGCMAALEADRFLAGIEEIAGAHEILEHGRAEHVGAGE
jgi:thioredoxin reductase (NADPH)